MNITSAQCRGARALLDWSQDQLSENAQVARATIADFERNTRLPMRQNLLSITSALEAAGIAFIPDSDQGEGVGVRFRKIEIEYNRSLKVEGYDLMLAVRYKGKPYSVVIPRAVCDDFGRLRRSTESQRLKAVQDHLPQILRAAEEKIIRGVAKDRFELEHADFPAALFEGPQR
jgi:transcriptional regulator with XRE-family HTH domain